MSTCLVAMVGFNAAHRNIFSNPRAANVPAFSHSFHFHSPPLETDGGFPTLTLLLSPQLLILLIVPLRAHSPLRNSSRVSNCYFTGHEMKRDFAEISDDEWEKHSFQPSRVLKTNSIPPAIESFSYNSSNNNAVSDESEDCFEILENLEDEDVEPEEGRPQVNRGRRFVVDEDSDDDFAEVLEIKSTDDEAAEPGFLNDDEESEEEEEAVEEDDVVGKALRKCGRISAELRKELYGSSVTPCDRYAEVEASSVRIVTQVLYIEHLI